MPAAVVTARDIADLVASTLDDLGPLRFQQIAQNLVYYEVFSKWFKKDKVIFDSGTGIQRTLMNRLDSSSARHVGILETDQVNIPDVLDQLNIPWRHVQTSWSLIYQTDILMNSGRSLILNVLKPRRAAALLGLVEELEERAWGEAPSPSDKKLPYSIQYWLVGNASTGFNGALPGSHSTIAGVDLNTTPTFKNYTAQYTNVSKGDLIKKMRTGHRKIRFVSPVTVDDYRGALGDRYRIYVNEPTIASFEEVGESQNENLGRDIASMDGTISFRRHPIIWVPKLDEQTNDPVYMVDHSTFYPVCLKGDYLRESEMSKAPNQHNVYQCFVDLTYNYLCVDRRRNAKFQKA
jgi:hypothetical protein